MVRLHIKRWLANVLSSLMCFPLVFSKGRHIGEQGCLALCTLYTMQLRVVTCC